MERIVLLWGNKGRFANNAIFFQLFSDKSASVSGIFVSFSGPQPQHYVNRHNAKVTLANSQILKLQNRTQGKTLNRHTYTYSNSASLPSSNMRNILNRCCCPFLLTSAHKHTCNKANIMRNSSTALIFQHKHKSVSCCISHSDSLLMIGSALMCRHNPADGLLQNADWQSSQKYNVSLQAQLLCI